MKTVGYYLDYMAQSFGVSAYTSLEAKHVSLFKKYLHNVIQDWENRGDMDYNKQLGMYKTRPKAGGTVTAKLGEQTVTLSAATDFYAVGCDLQINDKTYIIQQMVSTTSFKIWPAFMDADTVSATYEIRFNRFHTPPMFKKILNRRLIYLTSLTNPYYVVERDFGVIEKDNTEDYPFYYQIKYTSRQAGFIGAGTVSGATLTVTSGTLTDEMANMPIRFVGTEELYYLRDITTGGASATLDREIATAITPAVAFHVLPEGHFFIELYPHPNESKQIIYDYVQTEEEKSSVSQGILAPSTVIQSGLDTHLARFVEESASSRQVLVTVHEARKDEAKMKVVSDFSPTLHYLGQNKGLHRAGISGYPYSGYRSAGSASHRRRD
jgi:hypothetical protein